MFDQSEGKVEKDRSRTIMVLSGLAVLVVIVLVVWASTRTTENPAQVPMPGAGNPAFDQYAPFVKVTVNETRHGERLNVFYGRILATVKNEGDKTIDGLQLRAYALGFNNEVLRERIIAPIPRQQPELKPGESINLDINLEPVPDSPNIMHMDIELRGLMLRE